MSKSLNKILLIGNITKDPELKYTPQGVAIINFTVATNRDWKDSTGQKKTDTQFHKVIAWSKLAEICSQILAKGAKTYIEGRISYRIWDDPATGNKKNITEIIADEVMILDNKGNSNNSSPEVKNSEDINPEDIFNGSSEMPF